MRLRVGARVRVKVRVRVRVRERVGFGSGSRTFCFGADIFNFFGDADTIHAGKKLLW